MFVCRDNKVGVVTINVSSIGTKFENLTLCGQAAGIQVRAVGTKYTAKSHHSAQPGTLFWNIFRIASTPFHYLCVCMLDSLDDRNISSDLINIQVVFLQYAMLAKCFYHVHHESSYVYVSSC